MIGASDGSTGFTQATDQVGTIAASLDPQLDPSGLQNNGGPTQTIALLPDSPAIDKGTSNGLTGDLRTDQRGPGFPRTFNYPSVTNGTGANCADIGAFELLTPFSVWRKVHGAAPFDINIPLVGAAAIECRTGGVSSDHEVITTFPFLVASVTSASVTTGTGSVSSASVNGSQVTTNLTAVANAQTIVLTLFGVSNGTNTSNVKIPMGVLLGDTNGDRFINSGDALQPRNRSGQISDPANFRSDVNTDGFVNSGDTTVVRSRSGTTI